MRFHVYMTVVLICAVGRSGCAHQGQNEQAGIIVGGVLGELLGSQIGSGDGRTAAIIVGTTVATAVGGSVGYAMDETDRLKTSHCLETVRTDVPSSW